MNYEIRYPPEPEPGMSKADWLNKVLRPWRQEEKRRLIAEWGLACARCGAVGVDLDEAIITRAQMRGMPVWKMRLAYASCNLELVCAECNRNRAQDRDGAWQRACRRYGRTAVENWYEGVMFKSRRSHYGWELK